MPGFRVLRPGDRAIRQAWAASVVCGWCSNAVGTVVGDELITRVEGAADEELLRDAATVGLHKLTLLAAIATLDGALDGHDAGSPDRRHRPSTPSRPRPTEGAAFPLLCEGPTAPVDTAPSPLARPPRGGVGHLGPAHFTRYARNP